MTDIGNKNVFILIGVKNVGLMKITYHKKFHIA